MNKFSPYTTKPSVEGRIQPIKFTTTEEFLQIPIIQDHTKVEGFSHFELSVDCVYRICNDGFNRLLIGSIKKPLSIDIPPFSGWKIRAILADGTETVLTNNDIKCMVDEIITLKDGSKAIKM